MDILTWESDSGLIICMPKLPDHEPYVLNSVSAVVGSQTDTHKAAWNDGQDTYNAVLDGMSIQISGDIIARGNPNMSASALYENLCSTLTAAFNPKVKGTLYYETSAGKKFVIARAAATVNIKDNSSYNGTFDIDLECDSPYWFKSSEEIVQVGNITGGFSFPFSFPVQFGWYTQKTVINNYSGFIIEPTIEFMQATTKIIITNETTGEALQIDHKIEAGDKLVINSREKTITLINTDGEKDVSNWITLESDFITLAHGQNIIKISKERAKTAPQAFIKWHIPLLAR